MLQMVADYKQILLYLPHKNTTRRDCQSHRLHLTLTLCCVCLPLTKCVNFPTGTEEQNECSEAGSCIKTSCGRNLAWWLLPPDIRLDGGLPDPRPNESDSTLIYYDDTLIFLIRLSGLSIH